MRAVVVAALLLAAVGVRAQTTDVWVGGFPDYNVDTSGNWLDGSVPAGLNAGTDILGMSAENSVNLNLDADVNFLGLSLDGTSFDSDAFFVTGTHTLNLGSSGINLIDEDEGATTLTINAPLNLTAAQTWTGGNITVNSAMTGTGSVTLADGYVYTFNSASSGFQGDVTVAEYSTVIAGASTIFGSVGTLSFNDGSALQVNEGTNVTLNNPLHIGDASSGLSITFAPLVDTGFYPTSLTLGGTAYLYPADGTTYLTLGNNMTVTFAGAVQGQGSQALSLADTAFAQGPAVAVFQGSINGVHSIGVTGQVSLIFDGSGPAQIAALTSLTSNSDDGGALENFAGGYIGFGKNYVGQMATVLGSSYLSQGNFEGTLGLDTTSGATANFTDTIDLTHFTGGNFIGLGSATTAILSGLIVPVGGSAAPEGTAYQFGGGGGTLTVTSALVDSTADGNPSNTLVMLPGNAPLTLILSGSNTYTGQTQVDGGVLIFDSPISSSGISVGESSNVYGYAGATLNASSDSDPQAFINLLDHESMGVVGFDNLTGSRSITGPVDFTNFPKLYLGSATEAIYSGSITPDTTDGTYKFSGVKGGIVEVDSTLVGATGKVEIGLPSALENDGSYSTVILTANNTYAGGTTLNTGMLALGTGAALGSTAGTLDVVGPSSSTQGTFVGIEPFGASISIANAITFPSYPVHLNYAGSPYTLTLSGSITASGDALNLLVDGPVTLSSVSYYSGNITVNGTTLNLTTENASSFASILAKTGSTINDSAVGAYLDNVSLTGSTLNLTSTEDAYYSINGLVMQAGSTLNLPTGSFDTIYFMSGDTLADHNVINLYGTAEVQFNFDEDPEIFTTIQGSGGVELSGGTLILSGTNTYSGGTYVDSNSMLVANNSSALGTGAATVYGTLVLNTGVALPNQVALQDGGTLAGYGTFTHGDNLIFQNGSTLAPGLAGLYYSNEATPPAGALTFANGASLTFGPSGNYYFAMSDANGAPGVGYGTANISGSLTISANSTNPFTIYLYSYQAGNNVQGNYAVPDFNNANGYSWVLATATGGIVSFSSSAFAINTSGFLNSLGSGGFYVTQDGDQLLLNFSPVPEPSTVALVVTGAAAVAAAVFLRRRRARV